MGKRRADSGRGVTLTDVLRDAIQGSGLSLNKLAELADVPVPSLSHFMRGTRSLSLPVAEKLMAVLGVQVVPPARPAGGDGADPATLAAARKKPKGK